MARAVRAEGEFSTFGKSPVGAVVTSELQRVSWWQTWSGRGARRSPRREPRNISSLRWHDGRVSRFPHFSLCLRLSHIRNSLHASVNTTRVTQTQTLLNSSTLQNRLYTTLNAMPSVIMVQQGSLPGIMFIFNSLSKSHATIAIHYPHPHENLRRSTGLHYSFAHTHAR